MSTPTSISLNDFVTEIVSRTKAEEKARIYKKLLEDSLAFAEALLANDAVSRRKKDEYGEAYDKGLQALLNEIYSAISLLDEE